jgi:hypothetical protein
MQLVGKSRGTLLNAKTGMSYPLIRIQTYNAFIGDAVKLIGIVLSVSGIVPLE